MSERQPFLNGSSNHIDYRSASPTSRTRKQTVTPPNMSVNSSEIPPSHQSERVYKQRFWILWVFCVGTFTESLMWNLWSPMNFAVTIGYGWTDSFTALTQGLSNVVFFFVALPLAYCVELRGFGGVVKFCTVLLVATASLSVLSLPLRAAWLVYISGMLNGAAGAIFMSSASLLSSIWFPVNERTTATSVGVLFNYLGGGIGFIAGPYISGSSVTAEDLKNKDHLSEEYKQSLRDGIQNVMYFGAGFAVLSLIVALSYFPDRPPKPPSHSAEIKRIDFKHGLKKLFKSKTFWLLNLAFNLPNLAFNTWLPLVSTSFKNLGITETQAGWCGFAMVLAGCLSSLIISFFVDRVKRKMKVFIACMTVFSIGVFTAMVLIADGYIILPTDFVVGVMYGLCILAGISVNSIIPLYYEMLCECVYPIHEGLTCMISAMLNNLGGAIMCILLQDKALADNTVWMLWLTLAMCVISLPLLLVSKVNFNRLDVEEEQQCAAKRDTITA